MYADAMGLQDKDGAPLITWRTPEQAFDAWRECTRGRPVDYTGLSYDKLRGPSGIAWPCNEDAPDGTDRLYIEPIFPTATDQCETYGHDLLTGGAVSRQEYEAIVPAGRAFLKGAPYTPAHEQVSDDYPLLFSTGRTVYQFHTRTKTARAPSLQQAAPEPWIEMAPVDAARLGIAEGDTVRVESPRGRIEVAARIGRVREGAVFAPFHYGYWDLDAAGPDGPARAANELTMTIWDPVSKQPLFKTAACRVSRIGAGTGPAPAPTTTASAPPTDAASTTMIPTRGGEPTTSSMPDENPTYADDPAQGTDTGSSTRTIAGRS